MLPVWNLQYFKGVFHYDEITVKYARGISIGGRCPKPEIILQF